MLPIGWWLIFSLFHGWMVMNAGFDMWVAGSDSIISNVLLTIICTGAMFSVRYYRPSPEKSIYLFIGTIVLSVLSWWLSSQILYEFFSGDELFLTFLNNTVYIRIIVGILVISLFVMVGWISFYVNEKLEEQKHINEVQEIAREAELNNLRQQLQPHFLFNTLNSISALSIANPEKARTMIQQLSDFLRGTLKNEDHHNSVLLDEIDHLQLYLEIEKVRFGNRLDTKIIISKEVEQAKIPYLLLQPLVENAIKFGLYDTLEQVTIEITARKENQYLKITVTNPYDEQTGKKIAGTGFGLNSIHRRLYLLFGRTDLLQTSGSGGKFIASLTLPLTQ